MELVLREEPAFFAVMDFRIALLQAPGEQALHAGARGVSEEVLPGGPAAEFKDERHRDEHEEHAQDGGGLRMRERALRNDFRALRGIDGLRGGLHVTGEMRVQSMITARTKMPRLQVAFHGRQMRRNSRVGGMRKCVAAAAAKTRMW